MYKKKYKLNKNQQKTGFMQMRMISCRFNISNVVEDTGLMFQLKEIGKLIDFFLSQKKFLDSFFSSSIRNVILK